MAHDFQPRDTIIVSSRKYKNVFYGSYGMIRDIPAVLWKGGWGFWAEDGLLGGGPYTSEIEAKKELDSYVKNVLK